MRDPATDDDFRQELIAWFRANDVNTKALPIEPNASIADGQLTFQSKVQRNGRDVINASGDDVLRETLSVPLLVEPSPDIAEWLRPKCPTCGR